MVRWRIAWFLAALLAPAWGTAMAAESLPGPGGLGARTTLLVLDRRIDDAAGARISSEAAGDGLTAAILQPPTEGVRLGRLRLQRLLRDNLDLVREAELMILLGEGIAPLYVLFALGEQAHVFDAAGIVVAGRFPEGVGTVLGAVLLHLFDANEILLVRDAPGAVALWETARAHLSHGTPLAEAARRRGLDAVRVDQATVRDLSRWRRAVVAAWVRAAEAQVPLPDLGLILLLPLIATLVVIARLVVGIDSFGTFTPVIVALSFVATGLVWGVVIFTVIVVCGALVRMLLQHVRLQIVSRMAILIATVAALMAALTVAGATFEVTSLVTVSIFPMVIMSSIIENFATTQFEFGTREAVRLTRNTLLLACLCTLVIEHSGLRSAVLAYPELIAVSIAMNLALGKWRGLRLLEYIRFATLSGRSEIAR